MDSLLGESVENLVEATLGKVLRIANIESEWVLDVAEGVASRSAVDKMEEILDPETVKRLWALPPPAFKKLNAALAFRHFVDKQSLAKFKFL